MTDIEFYNILNQVEITWRYNHVEKGTKLPYGVYTFERASALNADNKVYSTKNDVEVKIYARTKDQLDEICVALEEVFENNDIVWNSDETYSMDEEFYLNVYHMEV